MSQTSLFRCLVLTSRSHLKCLKGSRKAALPGRSVTSQPSAALTQPALRGGLSIDWPPPKSLEHGSCSDLAYRASIAPQSPGRYQAHLRSSGHSMPAGPNYAEPAKRFRNTKADILCPFSFRSLRHLSWGPM